MCEVNDSQKSFGNKIIVYPALPQKGKKDGVLMKH